MPVAHLRVAQIAQAHVSEIGRLEARGIVDVGRQAGQIEAVETELAEVLRHRVVVAHIPGMDQGPAALGLVEELRHAEVIVGAEGGHRAEDQGGERDRAVRRPALGQEGFLDHDESGQTGRESAQGRLLVEEGIEADVLRDHHPASAQDRQSQDVL